MSLDKITFPIKRIDDPTSYNHARVADSGYIPLLDVLKRPAIGVDGSEFADFLVWSCNTTWRLWKLRCWLRGLLQP